MAAIASSDVAYSIGARSIHKLEDGRLSINAVLTFGNGALTYTAGGIPLVLGKLGLRTQLDSLQITDDAQSAYTFKFDAANNKLMMFAAAPDAHTHSVPAHAHDLLVKGGQAAAGTAAVAYYATDILGKEAVTDKTIAGSASATKGGVIELAAGTSGTATAGSVALAEISGAFAQQVLKVTVVGF